MLGNVFARLSPKRGRFTDLFLRLRTARGSRQAAPKQKGLESRKDQGHCIFWRRGPESNRPTRICNPVHNRFATAPLKAAGHSEGGRTNREKGKHQASLFRNMERDKRLELSTYTLARYRSTN
jgi:hypothetical protein